MDRPRIAHYTIQSDKLNSPVRILFFSDLHARQYGKENAVLLSMCRRLHPDLILCGGDLSVAKSEATQEHILRFMAKLPAIAPTALTNGNHESELRRFSDIYKKSVETLRRAGVFVLNNRQIHLTVNGNAIELIGLELPLTKFRKLRPPHLTVAEMQQLISTPDPDAFSILLAHSPAFVPQYLDFGVDLSLSGHYHGGVVRLWKQQVLISPYGFFFPRYGYGLFSKKNRHAVVTAGLGDHTIPFRLRNPEELVVIDVTPSCGIK